ncbi:DUF4333 domain-containing protein [Pseudoclavibacter endophyticus]|uniref:DUF4333 domain-containing protein n=2 Tax=Pseudoclavibacter endophyticus TaxID=1778590 RepID=A0A6H9WPU4_9MICO|nr:DUF4333 domain-containing protein [Pseudoclavibacter endophyticus]
MGGPAPMGAPGGPGGQGRPARRPGNALKVGLFAGLPLALVVGGLVGWLIGIAGAPGDLNPGAVQSEVTEVLRNDFGLSELEEVSCPDKIENTQGQSFQCTFDYGGQSQSVTVTISSGDGQLVVGAPAA